MLENGANQRQAYRRTSSNQGGLSLPRTIGFDIALHMTAVYKLLATWVKGMNLTRESRIEQIHILHASSVCGWKAAAGAAEGGGGGGGDANFP
jgi:hypothetical protein